MINKAQQESINNKGTVSNDSKKKAGRDYLGVDDIPGAQAGSLKKGI